MGTSDFARILEGYSLTTAEILYRMPDHQALLQTFIWQELDLHPRFPRLRSFLDFWEANLDGPLFKVTVSHSRLVSPAQVRLLDGEYRLN
ncbi:MAG: usg protein [Filomicrobium sp.]